MGTEDKLRKAVELGEPLRVIYQGGSQPGTVRTIAPISIQNGKVRAKCFNSGAVKLFMVEKLIIVDSNEQTDATEWEAAPKVTPVYGSVPELLEDKQDMLSRLGWHVQTDENRLSLHRRFKNGKIRKGPDVDLEYNAYTYDVVVDADGNTHEENVRRSTRPWCLRCKTQPTRTFGHLGSAAEVFMELAAMLAPRKESF